MWPCHGTWVTFIVPQGPPRTHPEATSSSTPNSPEPEVAVPVQKPARCSTGVPAGVPPLSTSAEIVTPPARTAAPAAASTRRRRRGRRSGGTGAGAPPGGTAQAGVDAPGTGVAASGASSVASPSSGRSMSPRARAVADRAAGSFASAASSRQSASGTPRGRRSGGGAVAMRT